MSSTLATTKTTKKIYNDILKSERKAIKEIEQAEKKAKKNELTHEDIAPYNSMIEYNYHLNRATSLYNEKLKAYKKLYASYSHKSNAIGRAFLNTMSGSNMAHSMREDRILAKNLIDEVRAIEKRFSPKLNNASNELNIAERTYNEWQIRLLKYEKKKAKYDTLLKEAISKRVYFEMSKRTNVDCATVVLSFLY